jgi:hypothetical protein
MFKSAFSIAVITMLATSIVSPVQAASPFIYRYKAGVVTGTVDTGTPTNPTNPTGPGDPSDPTIPTDSVACGTDNDTPFKCFDGNATPSETGGDPIQIVLTGNPRPDSPYQCMHVSGGYGNYVFWASTYGDTNWVQSLDIVARSDLDAPPTTGFGYTQYPGYDGDYDFISQTQDVCVRVIPKPGYTGQASPMNVSFTAADYTSDVVSNGQADYTENSYDQQKQITFRIKGSLYAVPQSALGMDFALERYWGYSRYYGPAYFATFSETANDRLRASQFYYQCFEYKYGNGKYDMQFIVAKYPYTPVPDWVEWFDLRTRAQINQSYQALPADHPGSQDASWPMNFPYDQQHIFETSTKEVCIRIKQKAGSTSTEPFRFTMYMMENFPIPNGSPTDPLDMNQLSFDYTATPVFNDPANDTPAGDDDDDWTPDNGDDGAS